jgi:protease I
MFFCARGLSRAGVRAVAAIDLSGKKIAVVLENKFIPDEIEAYLTGFALLGAEVELVSRIWYGDYKPASTTFYSDTDPLDDPPWASPQRHDVKRDVSQVDAELERYAAIVMSANYTSVRLRYPGEIPPNGEDFDPWAHVQSALVVQLFAKAMQNKKIVKGLLCHGLWVLTPNPRLLRGRKVICHSVVMADVINCGARIVITPNKVVEDDDLVTGFSKHEVLPFITAIARKIQHPSQA